MTPNGQGDYALDGTFAVAQNENGSEGEPSEPLHVVAGTLLPRVETLRDGHLEMAVSW